MKETVKDLLDANRDRILKIVSHVPEEATVLDIGCVRHSLDDQEWQTPERGEFLHADLDRKASTVVGIDLEESEVQRMRDAGYDARVANAETFELDEQFDVIVAGEIIEHLSRPGAMLEQAKEHLNPGGKMIVTTPNPRRFHMLVWYLTGNADKINPEHTSWYDYQVMGELAQREGWRLSEWEYYKPGFKYSTSALYFAGARTLGGGGFIFVLEPSGE